MTWNRYLRCLGFDLGEHLEKVKDKLDNADVESPMNSSPEGDTFKIARLPQFLVNTKEVFGVHVE